MANWRQKLAEKTIGIKGVDRNVAELTIRIDSLDDFFGNRPPRIIELHRELIIAAPAPVNTGLVDGKNYLSSDWLCEVAFLRVKAAFEVLPGDPEITVNGVVKSLPELRPVLPGEDETGIQWGFDIGDDLLTVGGARYVIRRVNALGEGFDAPSSPLYVRETVIEASVELFGQNAEERRFLCEFGPDDQGLSRRP